MSNARSLALGLGALVGMLAAANDASAQCCSGHTLTTSCTTQPTKSRWCIANDAPNGFGTATLPEVFCSWGDEVVTTLETVFHIQSPQIFEFDLMTCMSNGQSGCMPGQSTGGAQTPTDCGTFGNSVTFDAFTGNAYNTQYFWGYLLSLHEAINQWTGLASGGWPTDWWADHVSGFPNLMDFHIMNVLGTMNNDSNLLAVGAAQKMRFYPGGDSADARVVALDNVYAMMPGGDGLGGFSHVFSMVTGDKMSWGNLGSNPNKTLSEYVLSYMALAVGQKGNQVLTTVQGPGANGGGNICNGFKDSSNDPTYMCTESDVDAIANAHCALVANGQPAADAMAFGMGNYANVKSGPCGSTCPAECGCDMSTMHCVAPWIAGNGGSMGSSSGGSSGSSGGSSGSSSGGAASGGGVGSGSGSNGGSGGGSGGGVGGSSSGSSGGLAGSSGTGTGGSSSGNGSIFEGGPSSGGGCTCRVGSADGAARPWLAAAAAMSLALASALRRRRRPSRHAAREIG